MQTKTYPCILLLKFMWLFVVLGLTSYTPQLLQCVTVAGSCSLSPIGAIYFVNKSVTQGHLYDLLPDEAIVYI